MKFGNVSPGSVESENLHKFDDLDSSRTAHHHTLGPGSNQAAPGNRLEQLISILKKDQTPVGTLRVGLTSTENDIWKRPIGQSVLVADYQEFFDFIAARFGSGYHFGGSGANFNFPDVRDEVIAMTGPLIGAVGSSTGSLTVTLDLSVATAHVHGAGGLTNSSVNHNGTQNTTTTGSGTRVNTIAGTNDGSHTHDISGNTGAASWSDPTVDVNRVQPTFVADCFIKVKDPFKGL